MTEAWWLPSSQGETKEMMNPKAPLWGVIFWGSALEHRWPVQGVILSLPGQWARILKAPRVLQSHVGRSFNYILLPATCVLWERQKLQRMHTRGSATLGLPEINEGNICGPEIGSASEFAGLSSTWKYKAPYSKIMKNFKIVAA